MDVDYDSLAGGLSAGAAPAEANPYDELAASLSATPRPATPAFRAQAALAVDANPDEVARQQRIARLTGRPLAAVQALPEDSARTAKLAEVEAATADAPATRDRMTRDEYFAQVAHDDVNSLGAVERLLRFGANTGRAVERLLRFGANTGRAVASAAPMFNEGAWGAARAFVENVIPYGRGSHFAGFLGEMGGVSRAQREGLMPKGDGLIESSWYSGMQSAGLNLLQLPLALAGGTAPMLTSMGVTTGGQAYGQARDQGVDPSRALAFGAVQGGIEAGTEAIGLPAFLGALKPGHLGERALEYLWKEQVGEQIATHTQDLAEWMTLPENQDKTFGDYLAERPGAAAQTALAVLFGGGAQLALGKTLAYGMDRLGAAQQADQHAALIQALGETAAASKVLARDPETFESFVRDAAEDGPLTHVYLDAEQLAQSGLGDELAQVSPAARAQLPVAVATGGTVAIPIEEYLARVAPTDLSARLLDHLKTDPEGLSRAEAQDYIQQHGEELRAEVERVLGEKGDDDQFKASAAAVRDEVKRQIDATQRFRPEVGDAYATLVGNFFAVQAARLGTTPEALYQQFPLKVNAESVAGVPVLAQGATETPAFKNWFGDSKVVDTEGKPLVVYHGTTSNFDTFDKKHNGKVTRATSSKSGFFFTNSPRTAQAYADHGALVTPVERLIEQADKAADRGDWDTYDEKTAEAERLESELSDPANRGRGQTLVPVYLNIKNPLVFDAKGETPTGIGGINALIQKAKRAGHDGVIIRNFDDAAGLANDNADHYIAFNPAQIKSATGNAGTFDPNNPSILAQGDTLEKRARGAFSPDSNTITLLKGADLSTFLHESGHFFLEVLTDLASRDGAPQEIRDDAAALMKWFGVESLEAWHAMTLDQQREHHEKFARGFEAYLFEGKAPNTEMLGIFQRFRAWMLNVYRELKALHVELNADVRGVFDRMLASGEQIAEAEQARRMLPIFESAEAAGMTAEEFRAYQAQGVEATQAAIDELQAKSLRDMAWTGRLRERVTRAVHKDAAAKRKAVRAEVQAEVEQQPIFRALRFLKRGETLTADGAEKVEGPHKLSAAALREMYPNDGMFTVEWQQLGYGKGGVLAEEGVHPDLVAAQFGYDSGDRLVRALLDADDLKTVVEQETDQRMLERYGDLTSPAAVAQAVDEAVHNEVRLRMVATETNALAKLAGKPKTMASAAREFAGAMIGRLTIRALKPAQFMAASTRAARAAAKAAKAGDYAHAADQKRSQLIQAHAARAALQAQAEIARGLRYLKRFNRDVKGLDADYADQIHALLERFDLRAVSQKDAARRQSLTKWLEAQREAGFEPEIPPGLETEALRKPYQDMTVEEFRGLVDTVKQIDHLGRLKNRLLTARKTRAYEAARDEIVASVTANAGGRQAVTRSPTTALGRYAASLRRFWASHIKAATYARVMDGGRDGGPLWEYLVRPANERGDMEATMRAEATQRLTEIMAPVFAQPGKMGGSGVFFPSIGRSLNREGRIAVALNWGNAGNQQRLLGGEGWTAEQVAPVLASLTATEWRAVQAVWDHFETYRPLIAAKERRVYGREPEWVEPQPLSVRTADGEQIELRGGYYPIKYDTAASQRAEEHADAEGAKRQMQGAYTSATTRRSFTKARAEQVTGRPLLYTLSGLYSGVNDVIHDLAWHEWLIDANRLLRSQSIDATIRKHYGPEAKAQFKAWVKDIAEGERGADNAADGAATWLRRSVSASGLGFNVMSALMQPLGLTQSIVRVGAPWVARGVTKYLAGPVSLTREVNDMSEFMRNRNRTQQRELNELRNRVQDGHAVNEWIGSHAYYLMARVQQMVDVPTWWGAYEKAIAEGHDDDRAVALSDQAVIDSQGGGQIKDLSAVERGGAWQKLFTVFYSFMNTALNVGVQQTMTADTPAKRGKLAADYLLLYVAPAVLGYALKAALTPGDSGDDDKLAQKLGAAMLDYLMGLMVVVREFGEAGKTLVGGGQTGRDYGGPAGVRLIGDTTKAAQQAYQGEFDDAFRKAAINLLGDMTGLPAAQINRTVTGAKALHEGQTKNPAALVFGFQTPH